MQLTTVLCGYIIVAWVQGCSVMFLDHRKSKQNCRLYIYMRGSIDVHGTFVCIIIISVVFGVTVDRGVIISEHCIISSTHLEPLACHLCCVVCM